MYFYILNFYSVLKKSIFNLTILKRVNKCGIFVPKAYYIYYFEKSYNFILKRKHQTIIGLFKAMIPVFKKQHCLFKGVISFRCLYIGVSNTR